MIEVEIRGKLNEREYTSLKILLSERDKHLKHLEREMLLLKDYPGYNHNSLERDADIRLRDTNGECEIMVKRRVSENNVGREEISLKLNDNNLNQARRIFRTLGFVRAIKMERTMDVYDYHNIEWQVVKTPKGFWYYEAEQGTEEENTVPKVHQNLISEASALNLNVMTPEELQEFINTLDKEVNIEIEL